MSLRRALVLLAILYFVVVVVVFARKARENARKKTLQPLSAVPELQVDGLTG